VPEGKLVSQPVKLLSWQKKEIRRIYDNPSGTRRAIISFGRKNGKTSLAAFLLLFHLAGNPAYAQPSSQLYSAAQSRDQAALIFNLAAKIVRMSPTLRPNIVIRDTNKELFCSLHNTKYRALSAEASTAFGLSPVFVVHDELGQVRGPRSTLYEALETATGAQEDPLSIVISTQAPTDADLLSILIDDALAGHDKRTIVSLYSAPNDLNPFSVEAIEAANPALDAFLNRKEVMAMAADAKRMPARQAEYENLILNRRVEINKPFVSPEVWKQCGSMPQDLKGVAVWGGLDLSAVNDLTAFVLIGQAPPGSKTWSVLPTFWLPGHNLAEKAQKDHVPYDVWAVDEHLKTTPGATVNYEFVADFLKKQFDIYNIQKLAFDRWNMKHLRPWLVQAGFTEQLIDDKFVEFGQGTQSMSPALRDLEQLVLDKQLAHGNHPVLNMCAACSVVEGKDESNRKLSKNRSTGRIDGMVALAMACGVAPLKPKIIDVEALIG